MSSPLALVRTTLSSIYFIGQILLAVHTSFDYTSC